MATPIPNGSQRLKGQVAIVTGAGSGMGRAIAVALAQEGARVALVGRTVQALEETAHLVSGVDGESLVLPADVGLEADARRIVSATRERFGRIDILVNNAGTNVAKRLFSNTEVDDWNRVLQTNLTGVFLLSREVLPVMREQRGGLIVNVSSIAGKIATIKAGVPYSAAKHGVHALTQMINLEGWEHQIRATTIYPGDTATPILDRRPTPPPPELREQMLQSEDIAATVVYLAVLPPRALVEELVIRPTKRDI